MAGPATDHIGRAVQEQQHGNHHDFLSVWRIRTGLKATLQMPRLCPLHTPCSPPSSADHSLSVRSCEPVATMRPLGATAGSNREGQFMPAGQESRERKGRIQPMNDPERSTRNRIRRRCFCQYMIMRVGLPRTNSVDVLLVRGGCEPCHRPHHAARADSKLLLLLFRRP
eukprot:COSAG04_NODE_1898_length_5276_cov_3.166506_1_plen_169_part_00